MTLKRAKEILQGVEYELSVVSNQSKASGKAWERVVEASRIVLKELEVKLSKDNFLDR